MLIDFNKIPEITLSGMNVDDLAIITVVAEK